ncbi:hypothetical protein LCGC14_0540370 [marine sediment metagenome]|uniref:Uncharacterized protein n=1 Tax=marine sediment metagenome TaxID=412755 RepID=A0A0F9RT66_9ZZZZ
MNEKEQLEYEKLKQDVKKERRRKMTFERLRKEVKDNTGEARFVRWRKKMGL